VQNTGELQLGAQRPAFRVGWAQIVKLSSAAPDTIDQWASEELKSQHSCPCFHFKSPCREDLFLAQRLRPRSAMRGREQEGPGGKEALC